MNVGGLFSTIVTRIKSDSPGLDAQVILAHALNKPRTWIMAHPELPLSASQVDSIEMAVSRLERGEPLPYILGHWEFFGLDFYIGPDVLIPRPETELLVEKAIAWMQESPARRTVADVGTGSGVIGVSIAMHVPDAYVFASDISMAALRVAIQNARKFRVADRMDFVQCDLIPPPPRSLSTDMHFDLICANLPYIPTKALRGLPIYGREPTLALDGGIEGLDLIRRLLHLATDWLAPNGLILLEIEATQGMKVVSLAYDIYAEAEIHLHQDLTGRDRLVEIAL